jgi:hypothetical protein
MRLTSVDLYSPNFSETVTFTLRDVDSSDKYMVRQILGLDTDEIVPKFYGFGLNGNNRFYNLGLKAREIVIRVVLNPHFHINESFTDIRDSLYKAISATRTGKIVLHFKSGATIVAKIEGFITKFEVPYFSEISEVQLTVKCDDPMFRAINPVLYTPQEMKTVNPIMVPDSLSTAPHGFFLQVTFKSACPSFTIQDDPDTPEWKFKIIPDGGFLIGDVLYFSSDFSNKYLYLMRGATNIPLIDKIEPSSIWPIIFPGANFFTFVDIAHFDWNSLEYYAAYWGV